MPVTPRVARRVAARALRRAGREAGFTLIEAVLAMTIFAVVATALAGVLTSSISARSLASQRTAAEQIANDQLEWIRSLDYDDVGCTTTACPVTGGIVDPNGNQAGQGGPTVPAAYSVTVMITWVDDSVPTAHRTYKNYKNVTVTVTRVTGSKQMAQQSTQVGPRQRAFLGGINKGTVIVQVNDYLSPKAPHPGVVVNLMNGPSSPLSDTTDAGGTVTFPASIRRAARPTTTSWFRPSAAVGSPCRMQRRHTSSSPPAETLTKPIQVYKPVTLDLPAAELQRHAVQQCGGLHRDRARGHRRFHLQPGGRLAHHGHVAHEGGRFDPTAARDLHDHAEVGHVRRSRCPGRSLAISAAIRER